MQTVEIEDIKDAIRAGEPDAYRTLVNVLAQPMLRYAVQLGLEQDAAQDAVQNAFIRIFRSRARLRSDGSLRSFCFHVLIHLVRDTHRAQQRRKRHEGIAAEMRNDVARGADDDESLLAREAWGMLGTLDTELREVLALRFGQGLTFAQTAQVLALPEGTVKTLQRRGLEELKARFARRNTALASVSLASLEQALAHTGYHPPVAVSSSWLTTMEATVMAVTVKKTSTLVVALVLLVLVGGGGWWFVSGGWWEDAKRDTVADLRGHENREAGVSTERSKGTARRSARHDRDTASPVSTLEDGRAGHSDTESHKPGTLTTSSSSNETKDQGPQPEESKAPLPLADVVFKGRLIGPEGMDFSRVAVDAYTENPLEAKAYSWEGATHQGDTTPQRRPATWLASVPVETDGSFTLPVKVPPASCDAEDMYVSVYLLARMDDTLISSPHGQFLAVATTSKHALRDEIEIPVFAPIDVTLHVVSETNQPIAQAQCHAVPVGNEVWWDKIMLFLYQADRQPLQARTDASGRAMLRIPVGTLHRGGFGILIYADGYAVEHCQFPQAVTLRNEHRLNNMERRIVLQRGMELHGRLLNTARQPLARTSFVAGAQGISRPSLYRPWIILRQSDSLEHQTDADGRFVLKGLPIPSGNSRYPLSILVDGFKEWQVNVVPGLGEVEIVLTRSTKVSYSYKMETRNGSWETLNILHATQWRNMECVAATSSDQGFDRWDCDVGRGTAVLRFVGFATPFSHEYEVKGGENEAREVVVHFPELCTVSGMVKSSTGSSVGLAHIQLRRKQDGLPTPEEQKVLQYGIAPWELTSTTSTSSGAFTLRAVPSGRHTLYVTVDGYPQKWIELNIPEGASGNIEQDIWLGQGGRLVIANTSSPEITWRRVVHVITANKEHVFAGNGRFQKNITQDASGAFVFDALPLGNTVVLPESQSFNTLAFNNDPWAFAFEATEGASVEHSFDHIPRVRLTIALWTEDGRPAKQEGKLWLVRVDPTMQAKDLLSYPTTGRDVTSLNALVSDEEGRVIAHELVPGRYAFVQWLPSLVEAKVLRMIDVGSSPEQSVEVTMPPG